VGLISIPPAETLWRAARPQQRPLFTAEGIPQHEGLWVSDGYVAFVVPDSWTAWRILDDGFRLAAVSSGCVGFIRATSASGATAALCDTSRLTVLDSFDVLSSPVLHDRFSENVLVVDYRNYGEGRGVALFEPGFKSGATIFGLSGPSTSADILREAEQQLLSSACVVAVPDEIHADEHDMPSAPTQEANRFQLPSMCCVM
jgi:hypothetical protein